jgi:NADP-dependent 3-hydroxy acid dehydrogenase YdfG
MIDTSSDVPTIVLGARSFTLSDQLAFASFSGDCNPIHVDPVAARRTMTGQCVVHGMHTILWALSLLCGRTGILASELKVKFWKPVFLDDEVQCVWDSDANQVSLLSGDVNLATLSLTRGAIELNNSVFTQVVPASIKPKALSFLDCTLMKNERFFVHGDTSLAQTLFPDFCQQYGIAVAAEIGALSEIVGMQCPGLHSLFGSLNLAISRSPVAHTVYGVVRSNERFNLLKIAVQGRALKAEIEAFYRPAPVNNLSLLEVAKRVGATEFQNVNALIVGGSRGIGELVAKAIIAGGGQVTITYSVGRREAEILLDEIKLSGGHAQIIQLTVTPTVIAPEGIAYFNQIYFFATPKILGKRSSAFDAQLFDQFCDIYVHGFSSLCADVVRRRGSCTIFYPSTVYVDPPPVEFEHYAKAKLLGEAVCEQLRRDTSLRILAPRLPRMATDQTQAIISSQSDDPLDVMLPFMREMAR